MKTTFGTNNTLNFDEKLDSDCEINVWVENEEEMVETWITEEDAKGIIALLQNMFEIVD